jgi:hypothetical protein
MSLLFNFWPIQLSILACLCYHHQRPPVATLKREQTWQSLARRHKPRTSSTPLELEARSGTMVPWTPKSSGFNKSLHPSVAQVGFYFLLYLFCVIYQLPSRKPYDNKYKIRINSYQKKMPTKFHSNKDNN